MYWQIHQAEDPDDALAIVAPMTPPFRERSGPPESPWQEDARGRREERGSSSAGPYQHPSATAAAWTTSADSGWTDHSWRSASWAARDDSRAARIGDVPWHRDRRQPGSVTFEDSWQWEHDFPPLFPNAQDPHGPPQLYRLPMGQIVWKRGDPRHGQQETSNEAVKRLQSELGCYFV